MDRKERRENIPTGTIKISNRKSIKGWNLKIKSLVILFELVSGKIQKNVKSWICSLTLEKDRWSKIDYLNSGRWLQSISQKELGKFTLNGTIKKNSIRFLGKLRKFVRPSLWSSSCQGKDITLHPENKR